MSGQAAIRLAGLTKRYPGAERPAVDALDLEMPAGEIVALVGPSGCGKTTTLKMINRLIEPTEGTIEIEGTPVGELPVHELRRGIGYVIQHTGLFPHKTVGANIGTVPRLLGWDKARIAERVDELGELVGLEPSMLRRYPGALSGGQQQRVGVARALAADPPILLMDEPYSAVDPIVRARLQDELLDLQQRVQKTIVLVTHDVDEAIKLGDRVVILNVGGRLEQYTARRGASRGAPRARGGGGHRPALPAGARGGAPAAGRGGGPVCGHRAAGAHAGRRGPARGADGGPAAGTGRRGGRRIHAGRGRPPAWHPAAEQTRVQVDDRRLQRGAQLSRGGAAGGAVH